VTAGAECEDCGSCVLCHGASRACQVLFEGYCVPCRKLMSVVLVHVITADIERGGAPLAHHVEPAARQVHAMLETMGLIFGYAHASAWVATRLDHERERYSRDATVFAARCQAIELLRASARAVDLNGPH
jgi:hypothetical protein